MWSRTDVKTTLRKPTWNALLTKIYRSRFVSVLVGCEWHAVRHELLEFEIFGWCVHCSSLQHTTRTATHCDTLRHTATHCTLSWDRGIWMMSLWKVSGAWDPDIWIVRMPHAISRCDISKIEFVYLEFLTNRWYGRAGRGWHTYAILRCASR